MGQVAVWQSPHGHARRAWRGRDRARKGSYVVRFPSGWRAGGAARHGKRRRSSKGTAEADGVGVGVRLSPKGYARAHFPGRPPRAAARHMAGWVGAVHWCSRAGRGIGADASASSRPRKGGASANPKREGFRKKAGQDRMRRRGPSLSHR
jgi:hypothetical protein